MLIPLKFISRLIGPDPGPIIHVGAHAAEEWETYRTNGWVPRVWIEALPEMAEQLFRRFEGSHEDAVLEGAAWSISGLRLELRRASNGQSSSLLEPTGHLASHPDVSFAGSQPVTTVTLDEAVELMRRRFGVAPTFVSLDIQGAEFEALKGLSEWTSVSWVYTEASVRELYEGQALIGDLDRLLASRGFRRVATRILSQAGWGEALYVRAGVWSDLPLLARLRFLAVVQLLSLPTCFLTLRRIAARGSVRI